MAMHHDRRPNPHILKLFIEAKRRTQLIAPGSERGPPAASVDLPSCPKGTEAAADSTPTPQAGIDDTSSICSTSLDDSIQGAVDQSQFLALQEELRETKARLATTEERAQEREAALREEVERLKARDEENQQRLRNVEQGLADVRSTVVDQSAQVEKQQEDIVELQQNDSHALDEIRGCQKETARLHSQMEEQQAQSHQQIQQQQLLLHRQWQQQQVQGQLHRQMEQLSEDVREVREEMDEQGQALEETLEDARTNFEVQYRTQAEEIRRLLPEAT